MKINIFYQTVFLGIISSLSNAEYSSAGSKDGFGKKSGFDNSYSKYLSDYAGQLSGGKSSFGELHGYSGSSKIVSEHGSQFNEGESHHFGESFGEQDDGDDSSHFESFESLKFPQDIEAHHYTGESSSDVGLQEDNHHHHHHEKHNFEDHNYQFDEPAKSLDYKGYNGFEGIQIVPYNGKEEAEENEELPPKYSGYEHSQENEISKELPKSYEAPSKAPVFSHSKLFEAAKPPPPSSYIHSYEASKSPPASSYSHSYESSKTPSSSSYSHSFETSKTPSSSSYSFSHESSKTPSSSYESSKAPSSSSYSSSYEFSKAPSASYESIKTPSLSHEPSLGSYGIKYQHASAQEAPSKLEVVQKYKSSGLKSFHSSLQKGIMTINHGKGGYSFSSLYRH